MKHLLNIRRAMFAMFLMVAVFVASLSAFAAEGTDRTINDGVYFIQSATDQSKVLDCRHGSLENGMPVVTYTYHGGVSQQIKVTYVGDGKYSLRFMHSDKAFDVTDWGAAPGSIIQQWKYADQENQHFIIEPCGNGFYYIKDANSGLYLDIQGGQAADWSQVIINAKTGAPSQMFAFFVVH